jgi:putative sigma-54 modulation protein
LRIDVTGASLHLSAAQKERVVRRVQLTLSRFGPRVHRVSVSVAELAGPLGGLDRRCRMRALFQTGDGIAVEVINGQIDAAVGRAATRLAARVACALDGDAAHALAGYKCRGGGRLSPGTPLGRHGRRPVGSRRRERAR